jgi:hypothetical protein
VIINQSNIFNNSFKKKSHDISRGSLGWQAACSKTACQRTGELKPICCLSILGQKNASISFDD